MFVPAWARLSKVSGPTGTPRLGMLIWARQGAASATQSRTEAGRNRSAGDGGVVVVLIVSSGGEIERGSGASDSLDRLSSYIAGRREKATGLERRAATKATLSPWLVKSA
jgi:hypothetical protein